MNDDDTSRASPPMSRRESAMQTATWAMEAAQLALDGKIDNAQVIDEDTQQDLSTAIVKLDRSVRTRWRPTVLIERRARRLLELLQSRVVSPEDKRRAQNRAQEMLAMRRRPDKQEMQGADLLTFALLVGAAVNLVYYFAFEGHWWNLAACLLATFAGIHRIR